MTVTTQREECSAATGGQLLMAMELGRREWKLAFTTGVSQRPRRRTFPTDAWERLGEEVAAAKRRLGLPDDTPVSSCYEAGRDGFGIHRYLTRLGMENRVVDPSSIEVPRRARRAKPDRLDVEKRLALVGRAVSGERRVWRIVRVPTEADELRRQPHRELFTLKQDRTGVTNRMASMLATVGVRLKVTAGFRAPGSRGPVGWPAGTRGVAGTSAPGVGEGGSC
jgi:transposase